MYINIKYNIYIYIYIKYISIMYAYNIYNTYDIFVYIKNKFCISPRVIYKCLVEK